MSDRMDGKGLKVLLNKFLKLQHAEGDYGSGWPDIAKEDFDELVELVDALIDYRYGRDCDGDRPIIPTLLDRTRYERVWIPLVPHTDKSKLFSTPEKPVTEKDLVRRQLEAGIDIAQAGNKIAERAMWHLKNMEAEEAAAEKVRAEFLEFCESRSFDFDLERDVERKRSSKG